MIGTKVITVSVDIRNPINVCGDLENNMMNILRDKYEGKCYKSALIIKIANIVAISDCYINQLGEPTFGTVDVMFEAQVQYYDEGEIVTGCVIVNKDSYGITCMTEHACIMIATEPNIQSLVKDQKIAIRVVKALYKIGASKISINGVPYLPMKKYYIYRVFVEPSVNIGDYLAPILNRIKAEQESVVESNARKFFEHIIYAFKEISSPQGKTVTFGEAISSANQFKLIGRDTKMHPLTDSLQFYEDLPNDPNAILFATEMPVHVALLRLFEEYCGNMQCVREMLEIYKSETEFASHKNLWAIFAKFKV